jgi:hypothetical protein
MTHDEVDRGAARRGRSHPGHLPTLRCWCAAGLAALAALGAGCRGERPGALDQARVERLVDSLRPAVERAVGLPFLAPPRSAVVDREQVRAYVLSRVEQEFPPERLEGLETAYRLFGFLPDTLDLLPLLLDLYTEQVAGYYDPATETLYAVRGGDRVQTRLVMAHEMVHALQHQYLPLDSLMRQRGDSDRLAAVQAVLEGHATAASLRLLAPSPDVLETDAFWETYRDQVRAQQHTMPVFSRAPLVIREVLLFPYLAGAGYMRWWAATAGTPLPGLDALPRSTEQVLHPARSMPGDEPVRIRFADSSDAVLFEDTLGEMEIHILLAEWRGAREVVFDIPLGWGGDRYRVYRTPDGPALVWKTVWDSPAQAARFRARLEERYARATPPGYAVEILEEEREGRPGVRLVKGPVGWRAEG